MPRMPRIPVPLLAAAVSLLERTLPRDWMHWADPMGGEPPIDILRPFPRYRALAFAYRQRTRSLQDKALRVTAGTLDRYVARHLEVDTQAVATWLNGGAGAIFASPHYGPFLNAALLFAALGTAKRPSNVFYDPVESAPQNQRFDRLFHRFGERLRVLHNQPNDLIKAGRALRGGQCISIMFDVVQDPGDCMFIPFLGRLYPAMGGAAYLALLAGTPVIPTYAIPAEGGRVRVLFGDPLLPGNYMEDDREQAVFAMTCALFADFERQLRSMPWHWIYWNNVSRARPLDERPLHDEAALLAELKARIRADPRLLEAAPALGAFLSME